MTWILLIATAGVLAAIAVACRRAEREALNQGRSHLRLVTTAEQRRQVPAPTGGELQSAS